VWPTSPDPGILVKSSPESLFQIYIAASSPVASDPQIIKL